LGWFEGIYNQDEDRIKEVVASQTQLDSARDAFGTMSFTSAPTFDGVEVSDVEILLADSDCVAVWASLQVTFRDGSTEGVHVFRTAESGFGFVNLWPLRGDLWNQDCETQLEPFS
jgi:hypothetical protein